MTEYNLEISPAIEVTNRQAIEEFLEDLGYKVTGGGTFTDMSCCDISFSDD